ncbi:electron transport complex subunit RsxC [Affinibrenneria salicis]|uniref:Ion-translocating oxidoreductase complex subunit C n=1 Tax=Affinibrenneria salicis TaxID=2590031 RepID=A0A5J5G4J1_9GAMM|nr:electron transport complex subunit RsxC [Affinibrenneria salicis]KAA9001852.1 electron transport complex subunit RsxC [Affinibrenneria salicis]
MFKLFAALRKDKIWDFAGGIHPPEMKIRSSRTPLRTVPLPDHFIIPLRQHLGPEGELCVGVGDKVLRGQPLTRGYGRSLPVHAPTSGTVTAIRPHTTAHPSALAELSVLIAPDGEDRWVDRRPLVDYRQQPVEALLQHLHQAGIAGLGGAGFPTAAKLQGGLRGIETLIINAAECEPYITADDRLMQECAADIVLGIDILDHLLRPQRILIGIEDNKPEAIDALKRALSASERIELRVIPTKYPSGGAKQLTRILTGKEVPFGQHSAAIGVLMQNVGTVFAIKRAVIDGEPMTERVVTLTGEAIHRPGNVWARFGTPVQHLLNYAGFASDNQQLVIMGGPLMGFTLPLLDVPIVKISNCILAPSRSEMGQNDAEQSCIRCSQCADACPAGLLPQQLYWFSRGAEHEKARQHHLFDCIECGACAWVCPSNIPLVQYYRQEKAEIRSLDSEAERAAQAKIRYDARQARLAREKLAREQRHLQAAVNIAPAGTPAQAARAGAATDKPSDAVQLNAPHEQAQTVAPRKAAVAAAIARVKAAQAAERQETTAAADAPAQQPADPRKAAVAAAIARVKARKATQAGEQSTEAQTSPAADSPAQQPADPRKAAAAAAIARVKARKVAQAGEQSTEAQTSPADDAPVQQPADPRKAAVAAAIARVKARKAAQAGEQSTEAQTSPAADAPAQQPADPRKAAVAAAIARVKARKAAQAGEQSPEAPTSPAAGVPAQQPADPRKAAVAAAIARVKARKAAQAAAAQIMSQDE